MLGQVIWITGLSGAGKTTLAKALLPHIPKAILLDGDELRAVLGTENKGFDAKSRQELALIYARFAKLLASQGHTIVVATISLFHAVHTWNREHLPQYIEIFLDISEEERRKRDPKGLYKAERNGVFQNIAGLQVDVQFPLQPDLYIREEDTLEQSVEKILQLTTSR